MSLNLVNPESVQRFVAVVGGASGPTTYLEDSFTGANGTALSSHTPEVGGPWTSTGSLQIQSNKAVWASTAATRAFTFEIAPMATANGYMQADLTKVGNGDYGVVINVQDVDHLWMAWHSLGTVYLYEQTSKEAFTSRGTYAAATVGTLKIEANDDTIKVYVDGVERISYTVGSRPYKSSAACGLMMYGAPASGSSFDNAEAGPL